MKSLFDLIKGRENTKVLSERAELIKFFHERLRNKKGKPFTAKLIAIKLGDIKDVRDLQFLKSKCLDAENRGYPFSKCFWGSIKLKQ